VFSSPSFASLLLRCCLSFECGHAWWLPFFFFFEHSRVCFPPFMAVPLFLLIDRQSTCAFFLTFPHLIFGARERIFLFFLHFLCRNSSSARGLPERFFLGLFSLHQRRSGAFSFYVFFLPRFFLFFFFFPPTLYVHCRPHTTTLLVRVLTATRCRTPLLTISVRLLEAFFHLASEAAAVVSCPFLVWVGECVFFLHPF